MPIPGLANGVLPDGRHVCTEEDIRVAFVDHDDFASSKSRKALWRHWEAAVQLLSRSSTVHRAWISGSFVTDKPSPRDIDATFLISGEDRLKRSVADRQVIESFEHRVRDPLTGKPVPAHGMLVDSYIIDWAPHHPDGDGKLSEPYSEYAMYRGYWDDWWSRARVTSKKLPPQRADSFPRRGYLEVCFDDFV